MSKVAKATFGLMMVTMLSKCLGFGRELVLGGAYGANKYTDVYVMAMNIPTTLFTLIGTAIVTTFMPLYYENKKIGGDEQALKFLNNILNIIIILGSMIAILGFIFAEPLVKIFAIGFEQERFELTVKFTRIVIFGGLFLAISKLMGSFLQAKENFIIPGLVGLPFNIIIIISILVSTKTSIYILPIGALIAMISQFLFQAPFAYKHGYRYKPTLNLKDEYVKKMIMLLGPVIIGVGVNQINSVVDKTLASTLVEGSTTALNFANKLNGFVIGMLIASLGAVIYPLLSKLSSENNKERFASSVVKIVNSVIVFIIPISVGAMVLAIPIVRVLFQRGAFDERATKMTAIALIFYSIGMVGFALRDILGKVFYAIQDTKTPMVNGAIAMIMNIVLNIILVRYMGHAGLAFATSISSIICIVLLLKSLHKKIGYFGQEKIVKTTFKSLFAALVMGVATSYTYNYLSKILGLGFIHQIINLFGSIGVGAIIYGLLVYIMKVDEVSLVVNLVKKRMIK